jgi:hypothetical protein
MHFNLLGSVGKIIPFRGCTNRAYSDSYPTPKVACFWCTEGRERRRIEHGIPLGLNAQPCSLRTRSSTSFLFSRVVVGVIESRGDRHAHVSSCDPGRRTARMADRGKPKTHRFTRWERFEKSFGALTVAEYKARRQRRGLACRYRSRVRQSSTLHLPSWRSLLRSPAFYSPRGAARAAIHRRGNRALSRSPPFVIWISRVGGCAKANGRARWENPYKLPHLAQFADIDNLSARPYSDAQDCHPR